MDRRDKDLEEKHHDEELARRDAKLIRQKPEQALYIITNEKSVFDRYDVERVLRRYIKNPDDFQLAYGKAMAAPELVELQPERLGESRSREPARYSTTQMIAVERDMANSAECLAEARSFEVARQRVESAIAARSFLAKEQQHAIWHIMGQDRISLVVGLAGAGKSTMLATAREVWEGEGYQVHGAALAGKAAAGLEETSGIKSRTLASWEWGLANGCDSLSPRDVFVIDEAGMVGSQQLSRFITHADQAGAKIILVGDPEQLQPIGPGAAFRAVGEQVGFIELTEVRRQTEDWQCAASRDFGRHRTREGLSAYAQRGAIHFEENVEVALAAIVRDVTADMKARPEGSRLVLAHRVVDVARLNDAVRAARQKRGELRKERNYETTQGKRAFAPGDRLLFRENNRGLEVKNGMLGTVERAEPKTLEIKLDSAKGPGRGRGITIFLDDYAAVDHGYATTIHKAQGVTVDRTYVLASGSMDRHLTYVSMTRHRDGVSLYAGRDEFKNLAVLSFRLSRGRPKETTLDYPEAFAERRGFDGGHAAASANEQGADAYDRLIGSGALPQPLGDLSETMARSIETYFDSG